jgi:hypothetical protein
MFSFMSLHAPYLPQLQTCEDKMLRHLNQNSVAGSTRELHRQSDRRLSTKLLQTFADRRCHVVRVTYPYGRILGFLDRSR